MNAAPKCPWHTAPVLDHWLSVGIAEVRTISLRQDRQTAAPIAQVLYFPGINAVQSLDKDSGEFAAAPGPSLALFSPAIGEIVSCPAACAVEDGATHHPLC